MNYNSVSMLSLAIVTVFALILGYTVSELIFDNESVYKNVVKFVVVIFTITTFYSPMKSIILKKFNIDLEKKAQDEK